MNKQVQARIKLVNLYLETKDAGHVCRRCGISRPTLRKWYRRYLEAGEKGSCDQSKRPLTSPNQKITTDHIELVLALRTQRNFGARRIQTELIRLHDISFSLATIHKILVTHKTKPTKKLK